MPVSEVHALLTKIHGILDGALSKWVGNTVHNLSYPFNSASRQYCEAWVSQFPFLHSFKILVLLVI